MASATVVDVIILASVNALFALANLMIVPVQFCVSIFDSIEVFLTGSDKSIRLRSEYYHEYGFLLHSVGLLFTLSSLYVTYYANNGRVGCRDGDDRR